MSIELSPALAELVRVHVAMGRYPNEEAVVADALQLLARRDEVLAQIDQGLAELDAGKGIEVEPAELIDQLKRRVQSRHVAEPSQ